MLSSCNAIRIPVICTTVRHYCVPVLISLFNSRVGRESQICRTKEGLRLTIMIGPTQRAQATFRAIDRGPQIRSAYELTQYCSAVFFLRAHSRRLADPLHDERLVFSPSCFIRVVSHYPRLGNATRKHSHFSSPFYSEISWAAHHGVAKSQRCVCVCVPLD